MKKYWLGITLTLAIIIIGLTFGIRSTLELIDILSNDTKIELNRLESEISAIKRHIELNDTLINAKVDNLTTEFEYVQRNYSKLTHEELHILVQDIVQKEE